MIDRAGGTALIGIGNLVSYRRVAAGKDLPVSIAAIVAEFLPD